ncbi:hypothetical protein BV22DRAFT_849465 [Leucogyrophana mollusca]|uniref:Uncharacterized protein n=1 Tax=Leucogyrophana mollusca TaxID=85980 RepID=A0ACB8B2A5_9AGAM|nr:hypothetical protein BV22DRAFT_849465 [Leucogyrophana mollusca]
MSGSRRAEVFIRDTHQVHLPTSSPPATTPSSHQTRTSGWLRSTNPPSLRTITSPHLLVHSPRARIVPRRTPHPPSLRALRAHPSPSPHSSGSVPSPSTPRCTRPPSISHTRNHPTLPKPSHHTARTSSPYSSATPHCAGGGRHSTGWVARQGPRQQAQQTLSACATSAHSSARRYCALPHRRARGRRCHHERAAVDVDIPREHEPPLHRVQDQRSPPPAVPCIYADLLVWREELAGGVPPGV